MTADVRAITVKQPWAWAIAASLKLVENRSRGTSYRGTLLIHAGKAWSTRGQHDQRIRDAWHRTGLRTCTTRNPASTGGRWVHDAPDPRVIPAAAVIAVAQLVDSHPDAGCCRPWGESSYIEASGHRVGTVHHLVLEEVTLLEQPVPVRGALGLWRPPGDVLELLALAGVPL